MKVYSISNTMELERNKDGNIEAYSEEDLEFVIECLDGKYLLELEVSKDDIVGQSDFYIDSIKTLSISKATVIKVMEIMEGLIDEILDNSEL